MKNLKQWGTVLGTVMALALVGCGAGKAPAPAQSPSAPDSYAAPGQAPAEAAPSYEAEEAYGGGYDDGERSKASSLRSYRSSAAGAVAFDKESPSGLH